MLKIECKHNWKKLERIPSYEDAPCWCPNCGCTGYMTVSMDPYRECVWNIVEPENMKKFVDHGVSI